MKCDACGTPYVVRSLAKDCKDRGCKPVNAGEGDDD